MDRVTDLRNVTGDVVEMLMTQASVIEVLTDQRNEALTKLDNCWLEIRRVENERERAVDLYIETKLELDGLRAAG